MQADTDHRYEITAEVTDASRRAITGQGTVLVARKPFNVYAWVDRGHYQVGDTVQASSPRRRWTISRCRAKARSACCSVSYQPGANGELQPVEQAVQHWTLNTDAHGTAQVKIHAAQAGQYRLKYHRHRRLRAAASKAATSSWCAGRASTATATASTTWS